MLRRSEGDFDRILADSDLIVELIGGIEPAREYILAALRAGKPVVTANKQLVAQYGDELFEAARDAGVQIRFEAAVAGAVPVIRVVQEGHGVLPIERISGIVNGTTNFILSEMAGTGASYEDVLARAQELGYAEADPTDDVNGADAAAKMAILARLAFDTRVGARGRLVRGDHRDPPRRHRLREGARAVAEAARRRRAARRGDQRAGLPLLPLPRPSARPGRGPLQRGHPRGADDQRDHDLGPGAGGIETASAVLADVFSILSGEAPVHVADRRLEILDDLESSFYLHLEVADEPGVLARIADVIGRNGISVKSVVQRGTGREASLVMVTHRAAERDFYAALEQLSDLDFLGAAPRAIRVIEKEYS